VAEVREASGVEEECVPFPRRGLSGLEDALLPPPPALALGVAEEVSAASSLYRSHKDQRDMISCMMVAMRGRETFIEAKKLRMVSGGVVFAFGDFVEGVDSADDWSILVGVLVVVVVVVVIVVVVVGGGVKEDREEEREEEDRWGVISCREGG
jgi:hypothetical protein